MDTVRMMPFGKAYRIAKIEGDRWAFCTCPFKILLFDPLKESRSFWHIGEELFYPFRFRQKFKARIRKPLVAKSRGTRAYLGEITVLVDAELPFPAASVALPAPMLAITVPLVVTPSTATL